MNNVIYTQAWKEVTSELRVVRGTAVYTTSQVREDYFKGDFNEVVRKNLSYKLAELVEEKLVIDKQSTSDMFGMINEYRTELVLVDPHELMKLVRKFGEDLLNEERGK